MVVLVVLLAVLRLATANALFAAHLVPRAHRRVCGRARAWAHVCERRAPDRPGSNLSGARGTS
eukprot:1740190-Prymnesium_polylepis.1